MRNITISASHIPVPSQEDISALEDQLGIVLPPDYKNFLLIHNGGRIYPYLFPFPSCPNSDYGVLNWLFGVNGGEYYDLLDNVITLRNRMPQSLLSIGEDPGGNLICLSVAGADHGNVYFWDHEMETAQGEAPSYDNVYFIADSFDGLLNLLIEEPE